MAKPIGQPGPVDLLEQTAHLLRRASLDTLLCHWIGSAPFVLFLLLFWNQLLHPPVPDLACVSESLAAALLLIWMNCWRAVYSGRLHRSLRGAPDTPWTAYRAWRLVCNQAFLAAIKPILLPLSLLAVFPFTSVVTFFRTAAVLSDRESLDLHDVVAQAKRLKFADQMQCWLVQALLFLLSLAVLLNVAVTFIALPMLLKMVTGMETEFTRNTEGFVENRLFFVSVLAATWLVFDPFVQAVYCLHCFLRESAESGEDLRARLRRVRSGAARGSLVASALLLCILVPCRTRAAESVQPQELQRSIQQSMQAPEYNWRIPPPPEAAGGNPWIVRATDHAIEAFRSGMRWIGRNIERLLRFIFGGIGVSPMPQGGQVAASALHWTVWAALAIALALAGWFAVRILRLRRQKPAVRANPLATAIRLEDEELTADRLPESEWVLMAERCIAEGNFRFALRALYLANLAWLGRQELLTIHAGKSNREFEMELRRKARHAPEACALFSANVRAFERAWYGLHEVQESDTTEFRTRIEAIKIRLAIEVAA